MTSYCPCPLRRKSCQVCKLCVKIVNNLCLCVQAGRYVDLNSGYNTVIYISNIIKE